MNTITYPVTVLSLQHETPEPGDVAILVDADGKLVCLAPLYQHAQVIAAALNEHARRAEAMEVTP